MVRDILMYLFAKSQSRIDELILAIAVVMFINGKYKQALAILFGGGFIVALIEVLLGI